jgi:homocysteine S-methyltransferase
MYSAKHKTWLGISTPFDFSKEALQWLQAGARLIGGCCRTGPDHVSNLRKILLKNDPIEN